MKVPNPQGSTVPRGGPTPPAPGPAQTRSLQAVPRRQQTASTSKASQTTQRAALEDVTTHGACSVAGRAWSPGRAPRPPLPSARRAAAAGALPAEADGQAVPRVRVFFPPPASAVVLVVAPVAHGRPHTASAHRAVAAALAVAVGALHGQLHAAVLLRRPRGTWLEAGLDRRPPQPRAPPWAESLDPGHGSSQPPGLFSEPCF